MGRSNKNTAVAEKQVRGWEGVQQAILEDERIVKEKNKVNEVQLKQATQNFTNTPTFQPETFQLKNMLITDKIYQNYYNQIRHNMYVGIKAIYLVCRDFYDAKLALTEGSYYELAKQLNVSRSTLIKYESIGKIKWEDISKIKRVKKRNIQIFINPRKIKTNSLLEPGVTR